jgi:AcrR family transcriptional regulator
MKATNPDRRSERTRHALGEALVALLQEHRYADLTVQDILDRANIGRSTFYAHYWDKDDLLASEIEKMLNALIKRMQETPCTTLLPSLGLLQHVQEQTHLYRALMRGQGLDLVLRTLRTHLCAAVEERLRATPSLTLTPVARTVMAQSVVGTFLALLVWWMETESPLSAEEVDTHYQQLITHGVHSFMA